MRIVIAASTAHGEWQIAVDLSSGRSTVSRAHRPCAYASYSPDHGWLSCEPDLPEVREALEQATVELRRYDRVLRSRMRRRARDGG